MEAKGFLNFVLAILELRKDTKSMEEKVYGISAHYSFPTAYRL